MHTLDDSLLDSPERLAEADGATGGRLRSAAMAGAQVRATAEAAVDQNIDSLAGTRPRAIVLITRPGVGPAVAGLLVGLLGRACPVPLVLADVVPSWIGPLDVVLAHGDDPGDALLAESIDLANRRGARVVLTGPENGPVAAAAAGGALLLTPRVDVPANFSFARALTAGLGMLNTLRLLRVDLDVLADELDREAERDHAGYESFVNPAKTLALKLADHTPLLCGLDPVATAVADHAADALGGLAGIVAESMPYTQLPTRTALFRAAVAATSERDIFAYPEEAPGGLLRVVLLAVAEDPAALAARNTAVEYLSGAELLAPAEETSGGPAIRAAVLALRCEMAAVYLGLATGARGGPGTRGLADGMTS